MNYIEHNEIDNHIGKDIFIKNHMRGEEFIGTLISNEKFRIIKFRFTLKPLKCDYEWKDGKSYTLEHDEVIDIDNHDKIHLISEDEKVGLLL